MSHAWRGSKADRSSPAAPGRDAESTPGAEGYGGPTHDYDGPSDRYDRTTDTYDGPGNAYDGSGAGYDGPETPRSNRYS